MLGATRAIEHLARQPLQIEQGLPTSPPIGDSDPEDPVGQTWRDEDGEITAVFRFVEGVPEVIIPRLGTIRVLDSNGPTVRATIAPSRSQSSMLEAHHRVALPMILQAYGAELLHASAIRSAAGVVAFCGDSGAGKSTTAHVLDRRGFRVWSDDNLILTSVDGGWQSVGLPFRVRLREDAVQALGSPASSETIPPTGIAPLAAIYILSRFETGSEVEIVSLRPAAAFKELLPHASCFSLADPERNLLMIDRYLDLCSRVPVFLVRFRAAPETRASLPAALEAHLVREGFASRQVSMRPTDGEALRQAAP